MANANATRARCNWCADEFIPPHNGYTYCSKEHSDLARMARELRIGNQSFMAAALWIDTWHFWGMRAHIDALEINARIDRDARARAKSGRPKFDSRADKFRWMYRNDPLYRQTIIQRARASELKRKKQKIGTLTAKEVRAIYAERSSCLYCGCHLETSKKVLDHMDPLSKGGAHDVSNLVVACKKCNTRKAAKTFVQWLYFVPEGRRKLVADWYARKHGAPPEQIGLGLLMAA